MWSTGEKAQVFQISFELDMQLNNLGVQANGFGICRLEVDSGSRHSSANRNPGSLIQNQQRSCMSAFAGMTNSHLAVASMIEPTARVCKRFVFLIYRVSITKSEPIAATS